MTAIIEADELPDLGKVYAKVIREEARLNAAKSREVVQQDAIGFVSCKETQGETRDSAMVGPAARTDSANNGYGYRARDRVCSNCGKTGHEKNNCW